ncbi:flagellar hook-basal body complex protein [Pontiella agarivorans]|uniref:Flagellar hook protein FlgE n=1 Tax=Pontiella agarivorans TaxID=3038953 RepID=A0ABU5MT13_9BACT|nr:flagellar hook-basal body complex protein [Pontiella agarivorans]MDZ8117288.1 flagellar hook-basal body complex protein [Pontiella agarivorans]
MINSMWSGVSGLRAHQTSMDVIGNDIANVNTVAFKQSDISFEDAFYNSMGSPTADTAGKQVGMGVNVGKITQDFTGGLLQSTGVPTNLGISGDGFFVLKDAAGLQTTYSRAGDFEFNYDSGADALNLRGPDGKYLYGTIGAASGSASSMIALPGDIQDMMISSSGQISYIDSTGSLVENAYTVDIATFPGETGLAQLGGNQYAETAASGQPDFDSTDHTIVQGYLENSNVDLAKEFTEMIVAERGFQANSRTVTTSDSMLQELLSLKR